MAEVSSALSGRVSMSRGIAGNTIGPNVSHTTPGEAGISDQSSPFVFPIPPKDPMTPELQLGADRNGSVNISGRSRPDRISINHVPPFQFPAPSTPPASESKPVEHSPDRASLLPKMSGHRRGGSEFIGGDGSATGPGLMSTSPTKGEGVLPSPRMGGGRRGHMHRRSGAISSHDLSMILKPSDSARRISGSAPTTPSDPNAHGQFIASLDRSASQPSLLCPKPAGSASPESPPDPSPPTVQSRPRVGFSDKLEYIPRPLSTISSATSSSMSTIRASHSLTGSITSIRSLGTSSPPSAKRGDPLYDHPKELRPKTADSPTSGSLFTGPSLSWENPQHHTPSQITIPTNMGASNESSLFFDLDETDHQNTTEPPLPHPDGLTQYTIPPLSSDLKHLRHFAGTGSPSVLTRPRSSPEAKVLKRQKKGKSWTGLLSRRSRQRLDEDSQGSQENVPSGDFAPIDEFSLSDVNFDEDTTCVIRNPNYVAPQSAPFRNASECKADEATDTDNAGVLDLDATWESPSSNAHAGPSGFGSPKRRLHSSGTTGGFTSAGIHYHRRTESAPALSPVDRHSGLHRFGSNPQMADVFEEDETEETPDHRTKRRPSRVVSSTGPEDLGVQIEENNETQVSPENPSHAMTLDFTNAGQPTDTSEPMVYDNQPADNAEIPVAVVDMVDEPRFSVVTKSSDESTVTPTLSNDRLRSSALLDTADFTEHTTRPYFSIPDASTADPSPDPTHTSFDVPRLNTAHSSITDRSLWNGSRAGDSGQETCYSTEDVPSLTSSASTMISHAVPFSPASSARFPGQRSSSLSEEVPKRPRPASAGKRASLASLSRLMGGSYGEKSKLSIESNAQEDDGGQREKKRRSRIGRLMRFWKSKDNLKG